MEVEFFGFRKVCCCCFQPRNICTVAELSLEVTSGIIEISHERVQIKMVTRVFLC